MALETGDRVQRESKRREINLRSDEEGGLRAIANPRRRLTTRVVEQAGQNHPHPAPAEEDAVASPRRAAASDPGTSARNGASEASPLPSWASGG